MRVCDECGATLDEGDAVDRLCPRCGAAVDLVPPERAADFATAMPPLDDAIDTAPPPPETADEPRPDETAVPPTGAAADTVPPPGDDPERTVVGTLPPDAASTGTLPAEELTRTLKLDEATAAASRTLRGATTFEGGLRDDGDGGGSYDGKTSVSSRRVFEPDGPRADVEAGERTFDYAVRDVRGEGGMGAVYAAVQKSMNRPVALKRLKKETESRRQRDDLVTEAIVTGNLNHPHIVPVHELGFDQAGRLFYTMKDVSGRDWSEVLREDREASGRDGRLTDGLLEKHVEILMKVGDALAFAHQRGVLHCDVKPENVRVAEFGEVLLMDWGLAIPTRQFAEYDSIVPREVTGGSPAYMAPEAAQNYLFSIGAASGRPGPVTAASDVYLLGATLFEIATGVPPHAGDDAIDCVRKAAANEILDRPGDTTLLAIARRAMETDPGARFASVEALQDEVRQYRRHAESVKLTERGDGHLRKDPSRAAVDYENALSLWEGNGSADAGLRSARRRIARRRRTVGALAASLVAAVTLGFAGVTSQWRAATVAREEAERATEVALAAKQKEEAEKVKAIAAREREEQARQLAEKARRDAVAAREQAVAAKDREEEAKLAAIESERQAVEEAEKARLAELAEQQERKRAEEALVRVEQEKDRADAARDEAVAAEKEAVAARDRAEREKSQQRHLRYVATIGQAVGLLEEDEYGAALATLDGLAAEFPRQLGFEWRYLRRRTGVSPAEVRGATAITAVAASADGRIVAAGDARGGVELRVFGPSSRDEAAAGLPTAVALPGVADVLSRVTAIAFGGGGAGELRMAVAGTVPARDGAVLLYDVDPEDGDVRPAGRIEKPGVWRQYAVAFGGDAGTLFTSGDDGRVTRWDVSDPARPRPAGEFDRGRLASSRAVATSANGSAIVIGTDGGEVFVMDDGRFGDGGFRATFRGHGEPVTAVAILPDGRIASGDASGAIALWNPDDFATDRDLAETIEGEVDDALARLQAGFGAALERNRPLSTAKKKEDDGAGRTTDDVVAPVERLRGHRGPVSVLTAWRSERADVLVSGGADHLVKVWRSPPAAGGGRAEFALAEELRRHGDPVTGVAALSGSSSDPTARLVSGGLDGITKLWSLEDGFLSTTGADVRGVGRGEAAAAITDAVLVGDGRTVVTAESAGGDGGTVTPTDLASGRSAAAVGNDVRTRRLSDLTASRSLLVTTVESEFEVFETAGARQLAGVDLGPSGEIGTESIASLIRATRASSRVDATLTLFPTRISPDERWIASDSDGTLEDHAVLLWSVEALKSEAGPPRPAARVTCDAEPTAVCFDRGGGRLAIGTAKGQVRIFDLRARTLGPPVRDAAGGTGRSLTGGQPVTWIARSRREGEWLAASGRDRAVCRIDAGAGLCRERMVLPVRPRRLAVAEIDGNDLLIVEERSAGRGGAAVKAFPWRAGQATASASATPGRVVSLEASPDGREVLVGGIEPTAGGRRASIRIVAAASIGTLDDAAPVWSADLDDGEGTRTGSARFAADGLSLFVVRRNAVSQVDRATGRTLATLLRATGDAQHLAASADGTRLFRGDETGAVQLLRFRDGGLDDVTSVPSDDGPVRDVAAIAGENETTGGPRFVAVRPRAIETWRCGPETDGGVPSLSRDRRLAVTTDSKFARGLRCVATSADGRWVAAAGDLPGAEGWQQIVLHDLAAEGEPWVISRWRPEAAGDETARTTVGEDPTITTVGHRKPIAALGFTASSVVLPSYRFDATEPAADANGDGGRLEGIALASGSEDGTAIVWVLDPATREVVTVTRTDAHGGPVTCLTFAVERDRYDRLLTGSTDGTVRLWDWDGTGLGFWTRETWAAENSRAAELFSFRRHAAAVTAVGFGPEGRFAFSAGRDGRLVRWDAAGDDET